MGIFLDQKMPFNLRCDNDRCMHIFKNHEEDGPCEICRCVEFLPPKGHHPEFISSDNSIYTWICRNCFIILFPGKKAPPLDSDSKEKIDCERCQEIKRCSRISDLYMDIFLRV